MFDIKRCIVVYEEREDTPPQYLTVDDEEHFDGHYRLSTSGPREAI